MFKTFVQKMSRVNINFKLKGHQIDDPGNVPCLIVGLGRNINKLGFEDVKGTTTSTIRGMKHYSPLSFKTKKDSIQIDAIGRIGKTLFIIECKQRYFRPVEVDFLRGDAKKAKKILKWYPKISIDDLIDEMIQQEL